MIILLSLRDLFFLYKIRGFYTKALNFCLGRGMCLLYSGFTVTITVNSCFDKVNVNSKWFPL